MPDRGAPRGGGCPRVASQGLRDDRWTSAETVGEAGTVSEMRVVGIRVELPNNQPILLLRESEGDRYLPIWIGQSEATAIALEQQGVKPARPMTHDLMKNVITALGRELEQVRIVDLREGTFFAELVFDGDLRVSARPTDSIALALRSGVPIHADEAVLAEAGLLIPDEQEDEVEKFKEFLDSVSPEDFGATGGPSS
jgi:bifunctional DNase/RNase